jgi:hypothetical protein
MSYKPPYVITPIIVSLVAKISEKLGQLSVLKTQENNLYLRRIKSNINPLTRSAEGAI